MTTGVTLVGDEASPYYRYRSWAGEDGKTISTSSQGKVYRWRTIRNWSASTFSESKVLKRGRMPRWTEHRPKGIITNTEVSSKPLGKMTYHLRVTSLEVPEYEMHTVIRQTAPRVKTQWNAYTVTARTQMLVKGTHALYGNWLTKPPGAWNTVTTFTSNDELVLLSRLSDQIRGHSFNMGVAMAEGRQTVKLVKTTMYRFVGAIKALKRGRIDLALRHLGVVDVKPESPTARSLRKKASRLRRKVVWDPIRRKHVASEGLLETSDVSKLWLEIQYGWRPLIEDVYQATTAYAAVTSKERKMSYKASLKKVSSESDTNWNSTTNYTGLVVCQKRVVYELTELLPLERTLGLIDPRAVVWEVIPFSFVADWFTPISSYLDNLALIPNLTGRFLIQEKRINEFEWKCSADNPYNIAFRGASGSSYTTYYVRSVTTSLSVPRPSFNSLSKALSLTHLKNAAALLHVITSK